eukprot:g12232.t1
MEGFLGKVGCYIMEYLNDKLRTPAGGRQPNMKEVGSQAYETEGLQSYVQAYEENEEKMPIELQKKESQIEDLQWSITEVRLQRDQALKELEISERCAEVFRWVIIWVQHRSKWASPDMFAYVLLVDLVRTLEHDPLILSRARLEIGFSCFSTFVITATVSSLGIPLPQVSLESREHPSAPMVLRLFGGKGVAFLSALLSIVFVPLFIKGLQSPCMPSLFGDISEVPHQGLRTH